MSSKRMITTLTLILYLVFCTTANASSAPTSQFGFSGWPYRQSTNCNQQSSSVNSDCSSSANVPAPCPTAIPTPTPEPTSTVASTIESTPSSTSYCPLQPTTKPTATPKPSECPLVPTPKPTATPAYEPSQCPLVPTPEATSTPAPTATAAPVATPIATPVATPTATPVATPTATPVATPTQAPAPTATQLPSTGGDYTTPSVTAQEQIAFQLLNSDRQSNGRSSLTLDPALCSLARLKSNDMNANNYFAHTSPTLGSAADMLRSNGYSFTSVGENIAHHATVEKSQAAFMSSTGHRANILGSQWTKVGIGVCYDKQGFVYVTQLFVR